MLVSLPSLNSIVALVLAELHGRMGYFPALVRLRPMTESVPPQFEVAEILNLQAVRDAALQPLTIRALARRGVGGGAVGRRLAHASSESQARAGVRSLASRA